MSKASSKIEVVQYYMSLWYGIATGPIDKILAIIVDEKEAWKGSADRTAIISINNQDLFGGIKKEGGLYGSVTYLDGTSNQTIPDHIANKMGLTEATCPAHRGIASLFFTGGVVEENRSGDYGNGNTSVVHYPETGLPLDGIFQNLGSQNLSAEKGFYWRANQPSIPYVWVKAQRSPKVLDPTKAMIGDDANGVHIIYEVITNTDWGIGASPLNLNTSTFTYASEVIFSEGIGISILWSEQQTAEEFISTILDYINAVIFVNPRNGLLEIKLIRDDYDADDLFEITPENAQLSDYQRKMWGETVNELVVTWTNPENEEEETVTMQDLGNIAMQGGIVTSSTNYKGVRSSALAMKLAARDLRVVSSPLMTCRVTVNRQAWNVVPGSVVKVTWPEHGMSSVVMRVGEVDYGKTTDSTIKLTLTEDVFALDAGDYYVQPTTAWVPNNLDPTPLDYSLVFTMPYYLSVQMGVDVSSTSEDQVYAAVLAADAGVDISQYIITYEGSDATGATTWQGAETRSLLSRGTIAGSLPFSGTTSTVNVASITTGYGVKAGFLALLGAAESDQEFCVVNSVGDSSVALQRGVLDTTPKVWPSGTPIWFIPVDADVMEDVARVAGQTVTYRLLSMTSLGVLANEDAPDLTGTLSNRPWLPLRPANCRVNGLNNGEFDAEGLTNLSLTWETRNRLFEDSVLLGWEDGAVVPETGQTTTLTLYARDGVTVINTIDGLTGNSHTLPLSAFGDTGKGFIKFTAKNAAGEESIQGHRIAINIADGYGFNYGFNYGGA